MVSELKRVILLTGLVLFINLTNPCFASEWIRLATTTSTDNSGLFDVIIPPFEKMFNVKVAVIAVGTGKAIKLAESGDVDVILVHAPKAEERFVSEGYGINRRKVMHNDFIIIGPASDPAGINGITSAVQALKSIAQTKSTFISRGDDSGTHKKEQEIWNEAKIIPRGTWYLEAGQGMGTVLQMAHEKMAYALSDRGTYLAYKPKIDSVILSEGDPVLYNPYTVIAVNPAKHKSVDYIRAMAFIGFITSPMCQQMIAEFKKGGDVLFHPDALPLNQ